MWSIESQHDPFLPLVIAAGRTSTMRLGTNVAIAFARNPMTMAQTAHDLQRLSAGRFVLGLGTQVRAHIERRFAMPWSRPVARMREFVRALLTIWDSWETGGPLHFEGEFYRHTLMTPNFDPGPTGYGRPPVYLAAVGPQMVSLAAELADGLLCHPLTTSAFLSSVALPALETARSESRGDRAFTVAISILAATGRDDAAIESAVRNVRRKIAFYAATPAYRPLLEVHGLGDLQPELNEMAKQGKWDDMSARIDDTTLELFALIGPPEAIGRTIRQRFGGLADRVTIYELDELGRLKLDYRHLTEPQPFRELLAGLSGG